jgi:hypothetical protein
MSTSQKTRPYINRLIIISLICIAFVIAFNELAFYFQKGDHDRAPQTIHITIPAGTAQRINQVDFEPLIPEEQVFVVGDILEVSNQDTVSHQLGPIWVPPGASGKLALEQADNFSFACSFTTDQYLGLDVLQATTLGTRLTAISLAAPTMTALIYLYSLLLLPIHPKNLHNQEAA